MERRIVARYEAHVAKPDIHSGFIDPCWPCVLIVEQEKAGRDPKAAYERAEEYFGAPPERDLPRYILERIFQTFELHDPNERETITFSHADRQRMWIRSAPEVPWPGCGAQ